MKDVYSRVFIMIFSLFFGSYAFGFGDGGFLGKDVRADGKGGLEIYDVDPKKKPPNYNKTYVRPVPDKYNNNHKPTTRARECRMLRVEYDNLKINMSSLKSKTNKRIRGLKGQRNNRQTYKSWCMKQGMSSREAVKRGYTGKWWKKAIDKQIKKIKAKATADMKSYKTNKTRVYNKYQRLCK